MSKPIKEFHFGKIHRLTVYKEGFTLWDDAAGRWVIDASCLVEDGAYRAMVDFKNLAEEFKASYPKPRKKKNSRRRPDR